MTAELENQEPWTMRNRRCLPMIALLSGVIVSFVGGLGAAERHVERITVCIRAENNPVLTPLYLNSLARQVKDQLTNSLGALAEFEVQTSGHWLIDDYRNLPIDEPVVSTETFQAKKLSESVLLVRLEYYRSAYRIGCRLIDGVRGDVGRPETVETPDRQWVARGICLSIKRAFPVVAHVQPGVSKETISIEFPQRADVGQLSSILGEDCVLQPYAILRKRNGDELHQPLALTLVQWSRKSPQGLAHVVSNNPAAWTKRPGMIGWEAVKLNTRTGRIRLQIVDKKTGAPVTNCLVSANDVGFEETREGDILDRPDRDGVVFPKHSFRHVAFVRVTQGGGEVYKIPVPIVSDVCEQTIRITTDKNARSKADIEQRLRLFVQDVQAITTIQEDAVKQINEFNLGKMHEKARDRTDQVVQDVQPALDAAKVNLTEIKERARSFGLAESASLKNASEQFANLAKRHSDLVELAGMLKKAIETKEAQDRANAIVKIAQRMEIEGDIDGAIEQYEMALVEQPNQPELSKTVADLKEEWRIKGPEHEAARTLINDAWAKADITMIDDLLPRVENALTTLTSVRDRLTARRLSKVNSEHINELQGFVEQASNRDTDEDRREAERYADILQRLANFQEQVANFLTAQ